MAPYEINFRIKQAGYRQCDIASKLECSQSMVNNVIHNRASCYGVAKFISELISEPMDEIFPGRYIFKPRRKTL